MTSKEKLKILFEQIEKVMVDDYYSALEGGYIDGWNGAISRILALPELSGTEYPNIRVDQAVKNLRLADIS